MGLLDFFRTEWRVDPATGRHAAQISELHSACFARGWSVAEIETLMADRGTVTDILRSRARSAHIDGFALSRVAGGEAELLSIAVSSRRRGKGGSIRLLARHLARVAAAGARRIVLEVDEDNAPALSLYGHFGFQVVG
jgi:ribosomal-protein-alanine N-acetyltransferase